MAGAIGCVSLLCGIFIFNLDFILLTCGQYYIFISLNPPPASYPLSPSALRLFKAFICHIQDSGNISQGNSSWCLFNVWLCGWVGPCDFSASPKPSLGTSLDLGVHWDRGTWTWARQCRCNKFKYWTLSPTLSTSALWLGPGVLSCAAGSSLYSTARPGSSSVQSSTAASRDSEW